MNSIARIIGEEGPIGGAFVTTFDQVFTASHVINQFLGVDLNNARSPVGDSREIELDFPFSKSQRANANVVRWKRPSKEDVATLTLTDSLPSPLTASLLVPDTSLSIGEKVRIYGFPDGYDEGVWTYGVLDHRTATNQIQISLERELKVKGGFSGCPVMLNDSDAVVGMVVSADEGNNLAFMVPSDFLVRQLKFEEPRRGTNLWKVNYFRKNILTAILDDLYSFEGEGYDDSICETVRNSLGSVANALSVVDDRAFWSKSIDDEVEDLVAVYKLWNGCPKGRVGAEKRNMELRNLRQKRRSISTKIKQAQGLLGAEQDQEMMDDVFEAVKGITIAHPSMFKSLERSIGTLEHRA